MIQAWITRMLVVTTGVLVFLLAVKGVLILRDRLADDSQEKQAFSGAEIIGDTGYPSDSILIVVDAGHGGRDQGTCSGDILEKDINLAVAQKLARKLEAGGVRVLMTRTEDVKVELEERAKMANEAGADIFISIHCNYYEDSTEIKGVECYYREGSSEGEELANRISEKFDEAGSVENRGTKTADYRVLRKTNMQAVLVELGYMSNPEECRKLTMEDYQELLAEEIAAGIL